MKHATKILAALLLALAMVAGLVPGMSLTALAGTDTYTIKVKKYSTTKTQNSNATLPCSISAGTLLHLFDDDYGSSASGIELNNGTNISVSGTDITVNSAGTSNISIKRGITQPVEYTIIVTKNKSSNPLTYVSQQTVTKTISTASQTATLASATDGQGTVSYAINSQKDSLNADVTYFSLDGTTLTIAANTPVGTYTVVVRATAAGNDDYNSGTKDSTVSVTVAKPNAVPATVTANNRTYDGTEKSLVNVDISTLVGGTMQYAIGTRDAAIDTYSASIPAATDAGTYYVWYKVKGDGSHSDTEAKCIEVTINPVDSSPAVSNKALSFTGQPQPLVTAGTVEGGTMEYALGKDDVTAPTDGWSTEIPTGTEPGTYYVWYRVIGDENHNNVEPACVVVTITPAAVATLTANSDSDYTLLASMKTSGKKAFKLKWTAVTGAEGYDVFFGPCGGQHELKKTVTGTSCKIGKLKKGNAYKAFVKAWRTENGQKVYIGEASPDVHAVAGGKSNKFTNAKKITVKKKKLTVAVGGSKKIKASLKKFSNSRRYLNHTAKIRYFSSNRAVATVNAKGKVTGVAPGTCTVYAVAENGLRKGVKVTVK